MPHTPDLPKPVLVKDATHTPKTTGSMGLMIVGLGGANGTTLLAGVLANRLGIRWHGPTGEPRTPNYYGCITQLNQRGGGVGYKDKVRGLCDVSMAAVGGWVRDIVGCSLLSLMLRSRSLAHLLFTALKTGHSTDKAG
jgi:myo-inositol-1-phosphate synthase